MNFFPPTPELNQLGMTLRLPFCSLKLKLIYGWFVRSKVLQQGVSKRGLWLFTSAPVNLFKRSHSSCSV